MQKRDTTEIEALRSELPLIPPDDVLDVIKGRQRSNALVYRSGFYRDPISGIKERSVLVRCTACGDSFFLDYASYSRGCHAGVWGNDSFGFIDPRDKSVTVSGMNCLCPSCGAESQALHVRYVHGTYVLEKKYFVTVHTIRGHFVALSWVLFKECDKEAKISYRIQRYEGNAIVGGRPIRYTGYQNGYYGYWSERWDTRAVWKDNCDEWDEDEIFLNLSDFYASDASKSGFEQYVSDVKKKIRIGAYLYLWARNPQIENLVRSGFSCFVKSLIDKGTFTTGYYVSGRSFYVRDAEKYIDRKKVKPHEILGLEKNETYLAKSLTLDRLDFYRYVFKKVNVRLTPDHLEKAERLGFDIFRFVIDDSKDEFGFSIPFLRTFNYLVKQHKRAPKSFRSSYLRDYWNLTKQIQGSLPKELVFPKNLIQAHNRATDLFEAKKNEAEDRKIHERFLKLKCFSFADPQAGFLIRPVRSFSELTKEGKLLCHCVGSYAKVVASGKTSIFLIRKIEDPETPFYTLEYKDGKIVQDHGFRNKLQTPEILAFENSWLEYIKGGVKQNGKRTGKESRERAGA